MTKFDPTAWAKQALGVSKCGICLWLLENEEGNDALEKILEVKGRHRSPSFDQIAAVLKEQYEFPHGGRSLTTHVTNRHGKR